MMEQVAESGLRVTIAPGRGRAMLARDVLARAFGLNGAEAERLLARGGTLAGRAPSLALLWLLGVHAELTRDAPLWDMSLRLGQPGQLADLAEIFPDQGLADVEGPEGLVIPDLPQPAAEISARTLRSRGLQVTLAPQLGAAYDVFAPASAMPLPETLQRYLRLLGATETGGPALAAGLDGTTARLLTGRFRALGLVAVHQAFQRFDVWVTGPGRLSPREAADFLATRGLPQGPACQDLRVERGLNRAAARQFMNDYRHIGLSVRLSLCGLAA